MLKTDLKIPPIMVHAGGRGLGRENSVEAVRASLKYMPDIIELDVRKSRDGILYCYHGFPKILLYILACFLRFFSLRQIKKIIRINTLEEILEEIDGQAKVFLDIKERWISSEDIEKVKQIGNSEVWIAAFSLKYLMNIKKKLGNKYVYIYNFSFLNFGKGLKKAKRFGIDVFKIFPWQCNRKNIEKIQKAGMQYCIHPVLISENKYKNLVRQYGSLWVAVDDMRKPDNLLMQL